MKCIRILFLLLIISTYVQAQFNFRKHPYLLFQNKESTNPDLIYSSELKSMVVRWQLDNENTNQSPCVIKWGKYSLVNTAYAIEDPSDNTIYYHSFNLEMMEYSTKYMYKVEIINGESFSGTFVTPPSSNATEVCFYGYGDTRGGSNQQSPYHEAVCEQINTALTNDESSQTLILHAGDWICHDTEADWDANYFNNTELYSKLVRSKISTMGAIGNHEANWYGAGEIYKKYWPYSYQEGTYNYSFDYGPVHFTIVELIDEYSAISAEQEAWIEQDLQSEKPWKVIVFHTPAYSSGGHINSTAAQEIIQPLCEQYGVQLVIVGHNHYYSHWLENGVHHLTLGAGGTTTTTPLEGIGEICAGEFSHFAKIKVVDDQMSINVIDLNGQDRDPFIIPQSYKICNGANAIWDNGIYYANEIRVCTGSSLTIKTTVNFEKLGRVIVEPGGELIVDGGILTSLDEGEYWQGIEVWGNSTAHQFDVNGVNSQGKVTLKNGATIENAENAITNWHPGYWSQVGGRISATDAYFINNRRSVEFMTYRNFHPYSGAEMDYQASFKNCTFAVNDQYSHSSPFSCHMTMNDVKGIKITGSSFINAGFMENTRAIYTLDAGFRVDSYCTQAMEPCSEQYLDRCEFQGFEEAITSTNFGSPRTIYVNDAIFRDNAYGVTLSSVNNATIINNQFEMSTCNATKEKCQILNGVGVKLEQCTGYAIEENKFSNYQTAEEAFYYGVLVDNSEDEYNEIYKNEFVNIKYATQAQKSNVGVENEGLTYLCNHFSNNDYDIKIYTGGKVSNSQGSSILAAGNIFNNSLYNFMNYGPDLITYYYGSGQPLGGTQFPSVVHNVNRVITSNNNTCPSHYGGGDVRKTTSEITVTEQSYNENTTAYTNVNTLYTALEDGGNTEQLNTEVASSWPNEMWELRDNLLNKSPHLSQKVLKTTADKTEVLPESVIFEIMAANPHELRKDELIQYLRNKSQPLPDYMIELLQEYAYNPSYKSVIKSEMANYKSKKMRAAFDMVRHHLNGEASEAAQVKNWLNKIGGIKSDYQIVDLWLQEQDTESANQLMDLIPDLYELQGDALVEHNHHATIVQMKASQINSERTAFQLTEQEKLTLEQIAENSNGQAGRKAKNILSFVYGSEYYTCPEMEENGNKTTIIAPESPSKDKIRDFQVTISPNPAKEWTAFNFKLPVGAQKIYVSISDNQGRMVHSFETTNQQYVWDTRTVKNGVYLYTIIAGNKTETGKIVVKN